MNDGPRRKIILSRDGTFLMTPEQHRRAAERLRRMAARPDTRDPDKARMLANSHEQLAAVIERRQKPN